jgi:hypothetical protein
MTGEKKAFRSTESCATEPDLNFGGCDHSWILARISESLNRWYSCTRTLDSTLPIPKRKFVRTSSPTLIGFPPHPGNRTRSPAFTLVGTTFPSLFGAPGPTAMTIASGSGLLVAEDGRKIPVAVFCALGERSSAFEEGGETDCFRFEPLHQYAVEQRHNCLDGFERCLSSLFSKVSCSILRTRKRISLSSSKKSIHEPSRVI